MSAFNKHPTFYIFLAFYLYCVWYLASAGCSNMSNGCGQSVTYRVPAIITGQRIYPISRSYCSYKYHCYRAVVDLIYTQDGQNHTCSTTIAKDSSKGNLEYALANSLHYYDHNLAIGKKISKYDFYVVHSHLTAKGTCYCYDDPHNNAIAELQFFLLFLIAGIPSLLGILSLLCRLRDIKFSHLWTQAAGATANDQGGIAMGVVTTPDESAAPLLDMSSALP